MARMNSASATKSRSLTASILFLVTLWKPNSAAVISGEVTRGEPARAPEPSGEIELCLNQPWIRSISRASEWECLASSCEKRIGWAC